MCLIIKKPADRCIPRSFLENVHQKNPDGWGCFYVQGSELIWDRGMGLGSLMDFNDALPAGIEIYLHLRRATYGWIDLDMAHPFVVTPGLLLMHNGSIHPLAPGDTAKSDTWELARLLRDLLQGVSDEQAARLLRSDGFARLTAPLLTGSMVVLLDRWGAIRLGREWHTVSCGEWDGPMPGVHVSNTHAWTPKCAASAALG